MNDAQRYAESMVMHQAFLHVYYQDRANAAMHCGPVRYSPITFRLAECLRAEERQRDLAEQGVTAWEEALVWADIGAYAEDAGR